MSPDDPRPFPDCTECEFCGALENAHTDACGDKARAEARRLRALERSIEGFDLPLLDFTPQVA